MTARIREFLKHRTDDGPCLVVDLEVVRDNYLAFARALPDSKIFYAVKANPAPEILALLAGARRLLRRRLGERDRGGAGRRRHARAHLLRQHHQEGERDRRRGRLGVTLFAVDCEAEIEKIARAAPGSRVICRIHCDGTGSEWPLSRKFGCEPDYAADLLELARARGLVPVRRLVPCRLAAAQRGGLGPRARLDGGDLPHLRRARHRRSPWSISAAASRPSTCARRRSSNPTARRSSRALRRHFGNTVPETIVEPGRGLVGNAGIIEAEVVLIARRCARGRDALGLSRHRQVPRPRRDHGRIDPLSDPHRPRPRRDGALHHRRADLRFGRRAVREARPTRCRSRSPSATRC